MESKIQSVGELALRVAKDTVLSDKIKNNPAEALAGIAAPLQTDVWIYRMVVASLGLVVLIAIIGSIILAMAGKSNPEVLVALGSAAVGALAGLLAPSPSGK